MLQYLSPDSCSCTMCPHRSGIFYYLTTHSLLWISHPSNLLSDFSVNLFFYLASGGSCPSKNSVIHPITKWLNLALFSVHEFRYIFCPFF